VCGGLTGCASSRAPPSSRTSALRLREPPHTRLEVRRRTSFFCPLSMPFPCTERARIPPRFRSQPAGSLEHAVHSCTKTTMIRIVVGCGGCRKSSCAHFRSNQMSCSFHTFALDSRSFGCCAGFKVKKVVLRNWCCSTIFSQFLPFVSLFFFGGTSLGAHCVFRHGPTPTQGCRVRSRTAVGIGGPGQSHFLGCPLGLGGSWAACNLH